MTTLADLNPFTQIVSHPHVVPQAVERVIQATVSGAYLNRRLLGDARTTLIEAQLYLSSVRMGEFSTADDHRRAERCVCRELDRVWELQCMAFGVFG